MTIRKTTLSIAIGLILLGGASTAVFADDPPPDGGDFPPADSGGGDFPPPDSGGGDVPPPDSGGGDVPPPDSGGGDVPPPDSGGGDVPPPDSGGGDVPPPDSGGGDVPPPDSGGGDVPPPDSGGGDFPPDGGDPPPDSGSGDFPPDGGDPPPDSGSGDFPPDGGDPPPDNGGGDFPPDGEQPPLDGGGNPPVFDDGGEQPPLDGGGNPPVFDDDLPPPNGGDDLPPPNGGDDLPPPNGGGDLPPPDGGDPPPPEDPFFEPVDVDIEDDPFIPHFPEERLEDRGVDPQGLGGFDEVDPELYGFFDDEDLEQVPPEAYGSMNAERLGQFDDQAMDGIRPEQFNQIPPAEIGNMPVNKVGEFAPEVYNEFTPNHLAGLKERKDEFHNADDDDIGRLFTNLPEDIDAEEIRDLVPPDWEFDEATGEMTPPEGTRLVFKQQKLPDDFPADEFELPSEIPDFNSDFGLGGRGGSSVLNELNDILGDQDLGAEFMFEQPEDDFVLHVKGQGDAEGVDFSFKPDSRNTKQAPKDATPGLNVDSEGNYVLVTKGGKQMTVVPAPWNNKGLLEALKADEVDDATTRDGVVRQTTSRVQYNEPGVVVVETKVRRQDASDRYETTEDNAELSTDTNEKCKTPVEGEPPKPMQRERSPMSLVFEPNIRRQTTTNRDGELRQPGVYLTRDSSEGEVVYPDGRVQRVRAGLSSPSRFMEKAKRFTGVREVTKRADGTFNVKLDGDETTYKLEPTFDVKVRCLAKGEKHEPAVNVTAEGAVEFEVNEKGSDGTEEVRVLRMRIGVR